MGTRRFVSGGCPRPLTKIFWAVPLIASFLLLGTGCNRRSSTPDITITHRITPQPVRVGPADVILNLADAASRPITGAQVGLEADMSHAGMAPVFSNAAETYPGRYDGQVNLNMGGDWVLLVHITLASGQKLERQIAIPGVEAK